MPLPVVITSTNKHDIKAVTNVIDNSVIKWYATLSSSLTKRRRRKRRKQRLCLDRTYNSRLAEQEIIKRGCVLHMPNKRKRGRKKWYVKRNILLQKNKRWVAERTNSWHNRFRKLLIRYEKKVENYLGLIHLACSNIGYRKIVLGSTIW